MFGAVSRLQMTVTSSKKCFGRLCKFRRPELSFCGPSERTRVCKSEEIVLVQGNTRCVNKQCARVVQFQDNCFKQHYLNNLQQQPWDPNEISRVVVHPSQEQDSVCRVSHIKKHFFQ